MSERKVELIENVEKQNPSESLAVEDDIIDVSVFDFNDTARWLYEPLQYSSETMVHDLYAWLRNSSETDTKISIDTRTFTRPKKRNNRMSFESIIEALPPQLQNACKIKDKEFQNVYQSANKKQINEKESVPFMLKATMGVNSFIPDDNSIASGQESMEAFLNMSRSKGIDSFINLVEPEFGDPLMNISHPSILYSSIISLTNDDTLKGAGYESVINSESVSHPVMNKCQFTKTMNRKSNLKETFSSEFDNNILENKNEDKISINNTFTSKSTSNQINLNDTCNIDTHDMSLTSANAEVEKVSTEMLSSTLTNPSDLNITVVKSQSNGKKNSLDTTYQCMDTKEEEDQTIVEPMFDLKVENNEKQCSNDMTFLAHNNCANAVPQVFVSSLKQSSKHENLLNATFKSINKNTNPYQSTFMAPTSLPMEEIPSLRRELLTEIQRSGRYKLHSVYSNTSDEPCAQLKANENIDVTYDASLIQKSSIPVENKYNTYRKQSLEDQHNSQNELPGCNIETCTQKDFQNRKFYTFTKKPGNINRKSSLETVEQLSNMDTTFCKAAPKPPKKKLYGLKTLSKLPQVLQKSNPNLLLNTMKTLDITEYSHIPNIKQVKGSYVSAMQQNISKPMTNNSYSLGKLKSGSEQRLPHVDINTTFQKPSSAGSTESIDSTQSAHSAPDLDDRLSVCSDSSHNSYNIRTTNMERLHQIVCAQEEYSKLESTPLPNKILRNNWIDELKDLPSPISQNHIGESKSNSSSPINMDSSVKTSSPIISPTGSSQAINSQPANEEHKVSSNLEEKEQGSAVGPIKTTTNKPTNIIENKTRLRQPTNWNTGNKPPGIVSGIPRPPSRIPALRSGRSTMKPNQGDLKKGCL